MKRKLIISMTPVQIKEAAITFEGTLYRQIMKVIDIKGHEISDNDLMFVVDEIKTLIYKELGNTRYESMKNLSVYEIIKTVLQEDKESRKGKRSF